MFLICLFYGEVFFIINGCWILSKAFSASIEIIIWFLSFNLLIWCITLIDFGILKNPCIPGIKPTWLWCMIFLICCWILFARILLRIFHLYLSVIFACSFLFFWHLCLVLVLNSSLSHVRLCDSVDCSLLGSSIHGISQARILEWVAISFSRGY